MPIKCGDRYQIMLPDSVETYVKKDDVVRIYDAFVEHLDLKELGLAVIINDLGAPKYNPKTLLKLVLYSYSYGIFSSRKIERACYHNLSFVWLTGNLRPDHKTIANFRREHLLVLKNILKQCAKFCIKCDLVDGNVLFVDGTKIRANASIKNTYTVVKAERSLDKINQRIEELLSTCEQIDQQESQDNSHIKLHKDLENAEALKAKVENVLKELKENDLKSKNTTDGDCANMHSVQGTHAAYNLQHVCDDKHGLIVHSDVVKNPNDSQQFARQIQQAQDALGKPCQYACGDAGYTNTEEQIKVQTPQTTVVVPSHEQALHRPVEPTAFSRDKFQYDSVRDSYRCPQGHSLIYRGINRRKKAKVYCITDARLCQSCCHFGKCTSSSRGRKFTHLINYQQQRQFEKQYIEHKKDIYDRRKEVVEHPFGYLKRTLGVQSFMLRGLTAVRAEAGLLASCFNIRRLITIFGFYPLLERLKS
jgi:transposase